MTWWSHILRENTALDIWSSWRTAFDWSLSCYAPERIEFPYFITKKLPQGSTLSPFLLNIIDKVWRLEPADVKILALEDDLVISKASCNSYYRHHKYAIWP